MGIYDRDYYRDDEPQAGFQLRPPGTLIGKLVGLNIAVFLATWVFVDLHGLLALDTDVFTQPWKLPQLLTYGFTHAPVRKITELGESVAIPGGIFHILFNMFALFMFGRDLERHYGARELLTFYLLVIISAGLIWSLGMLVSEDPKGLVGASGGVYAIVILYCLNYPHQRLLLFGVVPIKAWLAGILMVGVDQLYALRGETGIAHSVHLWGALLALIYFQLGWKMSAWIPATRRRQSRLRVHDPDAQPEMPAGPSRSDRKAKKLAQESDRILEKIQQQGEQSLTSRERRTLEKYSRQVRQDRR